MRIMILGILLFATALATVYFKHSNRQLLIELHAAQKNRDALNSEWTQLLLEEGTLITHPRVEGIASQTLGMKLPQSDEIIWLTQDVQDETQE